MLNFIWHLLKASRYLLPYLSEVSNEANCKDDSDLLRAKRLRELMKIIIYRVIILGLFIGGIFWVIIPLHTRNAVLTQELNNRDNKIVLLQKDIKELTNNKYSISRENERQRATIDGLNEELTRLRFAFDDCKEQTARMQSENNTTKHRAKGGKPLSYGNLSDPTKAKLEKLIRE